MAASASPDERLPSVSSWRPLPALSGARSLALRFRAAAVCSLRGNASGHGAGSYTGGGGGGSPWVLGEL